MIRSGPSSLAAALVFPLALALPGCDGAEAPAPEAPSSEAQLPPSRVRALAEEAYVYAYPVLRAYEALHEVVTVEGGPGPDTRVGSIRQTPGADAPEAPGADEASDAPAVPPAPDPGARLVESVGWLDLRAEPVVLSVPRVSDRYYGLRVVDLFADEAGAVGTRATGREPGRYAIAGPSWPAEAEPPSGVRRVFRAGTDFVLLLGHTERRADELAWSVEPLSAFAGEAPPAKAPPPDWPALDADTLASLEFVRVLNFVLGHATLSAEERERIERWRLLGVVPGAPFSPVSLARSVREAAEQGIAVARDRIEVAARALVRSEGGWTARRRVAPDRGTTEDRTLARAAAARVGLLAPPPEEIHQASTAVDAEGAPLDGGSGAYEIRFEKEVLPAVRAFWSLAADPAPEGPEARPAVGDRSEGLRYGDDGSLTIRIQPAPPEDEAARANWLPAPDGPFSLRMRLVRPESAALEPLYLPPPVVPLDVPGAVSEAPPGAP